MSNPQSGTVLISTLIFMALAAILATTLTLKLHSAIQRNNTLHDTEQKYLAAQFVTHWASHQLKLRKGHEVPPTLNLNAVSFTDNDQITVTGQLLDLQSRFNLNNLYLPQYLPQFTRLIHVVSPNISIAEAQAITQQIFIWLHHENSQPANSDANTPTERRWFVSPSELRLFSQINPVFYQALAPFICALPEITPININTASLPLIQSLADNLTQSQAQSIISLRDKGQTFTSQEKLLLELPDLRQIKFDVPISFDSQYFLVAAITNHPTQSPVLLSIIKQKPGDEQAVVSIIQQATGEL